ncbi:MAG: PilN domain-containing protein [Tissierellia bacterium]|nr:PilN domain-containing protein [Tissierellia bacterium]
MRDINFFESFIEKKEFKIDRKLIYFAIYSFIVIFLIGYSVYNALLIRQESKIVESLRDTAEDSRILDKVEEILSKEMEVNEFKALVERIKKLDKTIEERDMIDEGLLNSINSKLGDNIFLTSMSIQQNEIYLVGISQDKWAIAEFQKGLENLGIHEDIFTSNISQQDDHFNFSINIQLRGDDNNG